MKDFCLPEEYLWNQLPDAEKEELTKIGEELREAGLFFGNLRVLILMSSLASSL